jgi:murein DD-endopeptidase MepM/ murein hydrolase activator NlpD
MIPDGGESATGAYVVKPGDTLLSVAVELDLDLEDAYCLVSPDFSAGQPLVIGDALDIFGADILCHLVAPGETLAGIAERYHTTPDAIRAIAWNRWPADRSDIEVLRGGGHLRAPKVEIAAPEPVAGDASLLPLMLRQPLGAPTGTLPAVAAFMNAEGAPPVGGPRVSDEAPQLAPVPADWPYGSGHFAWPLYGWLTQGYGPNHRAIDVAAPVGALVTAADRGRVIRAGWSDLGYGNFVVIDHNIDYVTVYAHLSKVLVHGGEIVAQGQPIGLVGSTGNSTGPHLHFEIRDFGHRVDPLHLLAR